MSNVVKLRKELKKTANPQKEKLLQRFFKTGKGEYGEGDKFLGIMVPQSRKIAKKYKDLDLKDVGELIKSKYHEERLIALFILINKYKTTNHKKIVFHFYVKNMKYINNWDLVDLSAPEIVGRHLFNLGSLDSTHSLNDFSKPSGNMSIIYRLVSNSIAANSKKTVSKTIMKSSFREEFRPLDILLLLAKSENLWERRIAVLTTFQFIKYNQFDESLEIAKVLLGDQHDLIHKAVGWMLREIGKRDLKTEIRFLDRHYQKMPRTMLRYAIERFPEKLRKAYLNKN